MVDSRLTDGIHGGDACATISFSISISLGMVMIRGAESCAVADG